MNAKQVAIKAIVTLAAVLICITCATAAITGDKPGEVIRACLIEEELT